MQGKYWMVTSEAILSIHALLGYITQHQGCFLLLNMQGKHWMMTSVCNYINTCTTWIYNTTSRMVSSVKQAREILDDDVCMQLYQYMHYWDI